MYLTFCFFKLDYCVKKDWCDEYCDQDTDFKLHTVHRFACDPMKAQTVVGECRKYDEGQAAGKCSDDEETVRIFPETCKHRCVLIIAMI